MTAWQSRIAGLLSPAPLYAQAAKNGAWEKAWKVTPAEGCPSERDVRAYLEDGAEDVALESFFRTTDARRAYFGLRHGPGFLPEASRFAFLSVFFRAALAPPQASFADLLETVSTRLLDDGGTLFPGDPDRIDLGVVDWWKSMGSRTIWEKGSPRRMDPESLHKALRGAPHLLGNTRSWIGLEFKYLGRPAHWISFEVSRRRGEIHVLDPAEIMRRLSALGGFRIDTAPPV